MKSKCNQRLSSASNFPKCAFTTMPCYDRPLHARHITPPRINSFHRAPYACLPFPVQLHPPHSPAPWYPPITHLHYSPLIRPLQVCRSAIWLQMWTFWRACYHVKLSRINVNIATTHKYREKYETFVLLQQSSRIHVHDYLWIRIEQKNNIFLVDISWLFVHEVKVRFFVTLCKFNLCGKNLINSA